MKTKIYYFLLISAIIVGVAWAAQLGPVTSGDTLQQGFAISDANDTELYAVSGVSDCTVGPCFDGTADSGTILYWMNPAGTFYTALQGGATLANRSWRLPIGAAPGAGLTNILNVDEFGQFGQISSLTYLQPTDINTTAKLETVSNSGAYASDLLDLVNLAGLMALINGGDYTPTGAVDLTSASSVSLGPIVFADADGSPSTVAGFLYDNTITGLADGGFEGYYDAGVQIGVFVSAANFGTGPTDDYVIAYDAVNDEHYYKADSTGSGSLGSNLSSATNDITTDNTILRLIGNSEDLVLTFTANTLTATSTTALDTFDFGTINLATDGLDLSGGSITNLAVGGLPDGVNDNGTMADDAITYLETTGSSKALTPVTGTAAGFAAGFTGANLYGGTYVVDTTGTVQLPAMLVNMHFTIITSGDIAVIVDTNAADGYLLDGVTGAEGANITNLSTSGDLVYCQYYTADDWLISSNSWTAE